LSTSENKAPLDEEEAAPAYSAAEIAQFVLRSTKQHLWLGLSVGTLIGALGLAIASCIPPVYEATCKVFIQDSVGMTSNLTAGRTMSRPLEGARALDEFILARDNLMDIAREAKLFEAWPRTRPFVLRIKDRVFEAMLGSPSARDMDRTFVAMLATSISAAKDGESVRIHGRWRDPLSAYEVTRLVQRNFLAARAAYELGPIQRAIPFLESQLQAAEGEIESSIARIQAFHEGNAASHTPAKAPAGPNAPPAAPAPTATDAEPKPAAKSPASELLAVSRELSETRQKLRAIVEPARQRVAALKLELIELQASYSVDHPKILQQQAKIAAASAAGDEVDKLKLREAELLAALARATGRPTTSTGGGSGSNAIDVPPVNAPPESLEVYPMQARLGAAMRKADDLSGRLETARIELATAEADFHHRYVVVEEAEVPGRPLKSKTPIFYGASIALGLLAVFLVGTLRELRRGRLVDPWQVRSLGLPLLGEVRLRQLPSGTEKQG
jgi:hypothetical protein